MSLDKLYAQYYARTRRYALRCLGADLADQADDVAQDTWSAIIRRGFFPPLLDPPHPEVARTRYLFTIVRRKSTRVREKALRELQKQELMIAGEQLTSGRRTLRRNKCEICKRPTKGRARLCEAHYYRCRRHGSTADMNPAVQTWRKLSTTQVTNIRKELVAGATGISLAKKHGVSVAQISRIKNHRQRR